MVRIRIPFAHRELSLLEKITITIDNLVHHVEVVDQFFGELWIPEHSLGEDVNVSFLYKF